MLICLFVEVLICWQKLTYFDCSTTSANSADTKLSIQNQISKIPNCKLSIFNRKLSIVNRKLSIVNRKLSIVNQKSLFRHQTNNLFYNILCFNQRRNGQKLITTVEVMTSGKNIWTRQTHIRKTRAISSSSNSFYLGLNV